MQVEQQLTIIMAVYNKAKVIKRALDSILNQKTNYSFKIMIIDDSSTDGSQYIAKDYMEQYPDKIIFYQNEKNMRHLGAFLRGCEMLKTPYWTVLDPDDYWTGQNNIEAALNFLEANPDYALYATNAMMVLNTGEKLGLTSDNASVAEYDLRTSSYCPFTHTSATFFRNYYNQGDIEQLKKYIGTDYEKALEGDTFRNFWHLNKGKGHYNNITNSIYEIDGNGIYSSLDEVHKNILNMKIFYFCYLFFDKDITFNFLDPAIYFIKKIYSSTSYLNVSNDDKKLIHEIVNVSKFLNERMGNINKNDNHKNIIIDNHVTKPDQNDKSNYIKKIKKEYYLFKFIPIMSVKYGYLVCRVNIFGFIPILKIRWKFHD